MRGGRERKRKGREQGERESGEGEEKERELHHACGDQRTKFRHWSQPSAVVSLVSLVRRLQYF